MAAFTHPNPLGSRFSEGSWGVEAAAASLETAVAEVSHHRVAFLARTAEAAIDIDLRWIQAEWMDKLHDLRGQGAAWPTVHDPLSCRAGQPLGRYLRAQGSAGGASDSVRHPAGQCLAVFKPRALTQARAAGHIVLHRDGRAITHWPEKGSPHVL